MNYNNNLIIASRSITARAADHIENMKLASRGGNFYIESPLDINGFKLGRHAKIDDAVISSLLDSFDIKPKNKKFFERSSALLFSMIKDYAAILGPFSGADTGLFCATGPANAPLKDFTGWASEIDDNEEFYPPMMASSVIKLLPNIIMSNLSINTGWKGENAVFSGPAAPFHDALTSMLLSLGSGSLSAAAAASVSAPFEYFNMDSFSRFLPPAFFNAPLCEGAASLLCCTPEFYRDNIAKNSAAKPEGYIAAVDSYKTPAGLFDYSNISAFTGTARKFLEDSGVDLSGVEYFKTAPALTGNFLSAGEPLNISSLIYELNRNDLNGYALSAVIDHFGGLHLIKAGGRRAAARFLN
jgi:hypothetical protein